MSNLASILEIPDTKMTGKSIKAMSSAVTQATNDLAEAVLGVQQAKNELSVTAESNTPAPAEEKKQRGRPRKVTPKVASILHDGQLIEDRQDMLDRAEEYLRYQAVEIYEQSTEMLAQIKSELIQGAPPQLWTAYTGLLKAVNDCHKRLEEVYRRIGEKFEFDTTGGLPDEEAAAVTNDKPTTLSGTLDDVYRLIANSRGVNLDAPGVMDDIKNKVVEAEYSVSEA